MLLPESMSRVVIVGTKSRMEEAIEAFYSVKSIHVIDHTTGDDGLSIGSPTEKTTAASERLLKVRAMEKELGINKHTKTGVISVEDVQMQIENGDIESVEIEVLKTVDERNDLVQKITELNAKKKILETLSKLTECPTLDLFNGYKRLSVIVGTTSEDAAPLKGRIANAEVFTGFSKEDGGVVAIFVKNEDRAAAASALSEFGFVEMQVPVYTEKVTVDAACKQIDIEIQHAEEMVEATKKTLEALREKHKSFLKGCDEDLAIAVEKGSVPLKVAVSKYSYIMDAWVPERKLDSVKSVLRTKLGDSVYIECEETRGRKNEDSEHVEPRFQEVPVKQKHGSYVKEFEYATSLVSTPNYREIDPTALIAIFLPLFFGYMVGDCGYAIPFIILGAYGLHKTKHKDWRAVALALCYGGIWAFIFGFFFYGEMLGMHFVGGEWHEGIWHWHENSVAVGGTSVTWDWLLGVDFPDWFLGILATVDEGSGIGKLEDIAFLLKLAVYMGIVHLFIGHVCGFYNVLLKENGKTAFIHKGGIIITFFAMILFCYSLTEYMISGKNLFEGTLEIIFILSLVLLVVGIVINVKAEGAMQAIMALPENIGQILSYTRLAAIAMSKAGMALAFNYIVFGMVMSTKTGFFNGVECTIFDPFGNVALLILGLVMFGFLHLVIWTLAILSGGIHALRLQYVELMMRFFDGGGISFKPLKEVRTKTAYKNSINNTIKEV